MYPYNHKQTEFAFATHTHGEDCFKRTVDGRPYCRPNGSALNPVDAESMIRVARWQHQSKEARRIPPSKWTPKDNGLILVCPLVVNRNA